jgi:hypothetical protein
VNQYAAVKPQERMDFITDSASVVSVLRKDPNAAAFGVSTINPEPMAVSAVLLPPAKLRYGNVSLSVCPKPSQH